MLNEIILTLYRGLNGTNPSAFRVDEDGVSLFENPLPDYKFNLPIRAVYQGEKVAGTIAEIAEPMLKGGIAEYTPQFGEGHWSLHFPGLENQESKILDLLRRVKFRNRCNQWTCHYGCRWLS